MFEGASATLPTKEMDIINVIIMEDQMGKARTLDVQVIVIEKEALPMANNKVLLKNLGTDKMTPTPYMKIWGGEGPQMGKWGGKQGHAHAIYSSNNSQESMRVTTLKKRVILYNLKGENIFLDDDCTPN